MSQFSSRRGPRWLVNCAAALGPDLAATLATPGNDLYRDDVCHVHTVYSAVIDVPGHNKGVYAAMQALFDWHNLRTTDSPTEGFLRCLAIYGAAAHAVLEG